MPAVVGAVPRAGRGPSDPAAGTRRRSDGEGSGFPDLDVVGWQVLAGPPKLPAAVVQKWTALLEEASKDPAFLEQAAKLNKVFAYKGPDAFWQFLPLATRMGIRK